MSSVLESLVVALAASQCLLGVQGARLPVTPNVAVRDDSALPEYLPYLLTRDEEPSPPAEAPKAEGAPADEPKVEGAPTEEPKVEGAPADSPKVEGAPAEDAALTASSASAAGAPAPSDPPSESPDPDSDPASSTAVTASSLVASALSAPSSSSAAASSAAPPPPPPGRPRRVFATNQNLPAFNKPGPGGYDSSLSLTGPTNILKSSTANPVAPAGNVDCPVTYNATLSGTENFKNDFIRFGGGFALHDVQQGGIGNCGFGAAMLAIRGNDMMSDLNYALRQTDYSVNNPRFRARFRAINGVTTEILLDDKLPYQDCYKSLASFAAPCKHYYVPLMEKAFVKFLDAHPDWRTIDGSLGAAEKKEVKSWTGYRAMQSIDPRNVMRAITGQRRRNVYRRKANFDQVFANNMIKCLNGPYGCALLTPHVDNYVSSWGKFPKGKTRHFTDGAQIQPAADGIFVVYDRDNDFKAHYLASSHWYAIIRNKSPSKITPLQAHNLANDIMVTIRNPWGCNPGKGTGNGCVEYKETREDRCEKRTDDGEMVISLRALWSVFVGIDTVF